MLAVKSCVHLVLGDPSRGGCGLGLSCIAHSRNWALKPAITPQRPTRYARWTYLLFTMAADAYLVPGTRVCREGRLNMRWRNERPSAIFQRPPGLMLRSLVVFDRPSHPHVTCVESSHRSAASLVRLGDYWRSQSPEYSDEFTLRTSVAALRPCLS